MRGKKCQVFSRGRTAFARDFPGIAACSNFCHSEDERKRGRRIPLWREAVMRLRFPNAHFIRIGDPSLGIATSFPLVTPRNDRVFRAAGLWVQPMAKKEHGKPCSFLSQIFSQSISPPSVVSSLVVKGILMPSFVYTSVTDSRYTFSLE